MLQVLNSLKYKQIVIWQLEFAQHFFVLLRALKTTT